MPSRDLLVVTATFVFLLLVAILVPGQEELKDSGLPPLSTYSSADNGGSILYRWLGQLGYRVERLERRAFRIDDRTSALLILAPSDGFDRAQEDEVERFVRSGGVMLYAGTREPSHLMTTPGTTASLLSRFGVRYEKGSEVHNAVPALALLTSPPAATAVVATDASVGPNDDALPLLSADGASGRLILTALQVGAGKLIVLSSSHLLSNAGLPQADNWRVVLNLLPDPGAGPILFDEYHHGMGLTADGSLQSVMWQRPWGWSAIGALILALGFIGARGKRFGRAILVSRNARRAPAEYVYSLSTLLRRSRHQSWVRAHYASGLKGAVRQRLGVGDDIIPRLEREALVAESLSAQDVLAVLEELESSRHLKEGELVALVGTAEGMRAQLEGRRGKS